MSQKLENGMMGTVVPEFLARGGLVLQGLVGPNTINNIGAKVPYHASYFPGYCKDSEGKLGIHTPDGVTESEVVLAAITGLTAELDKSEFVHTGLTIKFVDNLEVKENGIQATDKSGLITFAKQPNHGRFVNTRQPITREKGKFYRYGDVTTTPDPHNVGLIFGLTRLATKHMLLQTFQLTVETQRAQEQLSQAFRDYQGDENNEPTSFWQKLMSNFSR